ncbi:MAG: MBL fold metallo-hydrolase, partial [Candidatus Heimdallarchaeota archaeon]
LKIITLGSGNPFAHGNSFQSVHYIEINQKKILFDCGPAILNAAQNAEVDLSDLEYLFISHLHGDHMSGIPFLILSYKFDLQRIKPLKIIGPYGLSEQLDFAIKGSYPGLLSKEENLFEVIELELNQNFTIYDNIQIKPFKAFHIPNAFCFSLEYQNLKVVYSGDNEFNPVQLQELDNTTVLIHELTTMSSSKGGHTSWKLMKEFLNEIELKTKYIILVHTSQDVRDEPNKTFPNSVFRARDGSVFEFNQEGMLFHMVL